MKIVQKSFVSECFHCMYIEDGYRHNLSIKDAILSLFRFHNETMNIWSHLIGFISIIIAAIVICIDLYENSEDTSTDFFAVECYLFCAALCLLLSTVYHWFGCLSEDCHQILLKLDITGVAVLVTGSFIPGVYYGKFLQIIPTV